MLYADYKELYEEANNYFWHKNAEQIKIEEYSKKLKELRNNFTKEDWEHLIKDTANGRAKYEYTRMMKEHFPD